MSKLSPNSVSGICSSNRSPDSVSSVSSVCLSECSTVASDSGVAEHSMALVIVEESGVIGVVSALLAFSLVV